MKLKKLLVDFGQVKSLREMHEELARIFAFPDFYGKNVNALIDCWSSLCYPEDKMTGIVLAMDETVLLEVKGMPNLDEMMMNHFVVAVENVNERAMDRNEQPLMLLFPVP